MTINEEIKKDFGRIYSNKTDTYSIVCDNNIIRNSYFQFCQNIITKNFKNIARIVIFDSS